MQCNQYKIDLKSFRYEKICIKLFIPHRVKKLLYEYILIIYNKKCFYGSLEIKYYLFCLKMKLEMI